MIGHTRWRFREVDSTQKVAFRLAEMGAGHGTVVRAGYQTAGRGRQGRTWDVPADTALMFSVLLRPPMQLDQFGSLSIRLASILCKIFEQAGAPEVALKWPNDVLIGGRKVSGILVQTRTMPELVAVAGIGINISTPLDALPSTATSLDVATGGEMDADALLDGMLRAMDDMWGGWEPQLSPEERARIDHRLWCNGEPVTLLDADRMITGRITGIAPSGALRLVQNGSEQLIHAGEITRGPRSIEDLRSH